VEQSGCILRDAIAEGPVLLFHFDKIDENVLTPQADSLVQSVGNCFVEGFLYFDCPSLVEGELDDQGVRASLDAKVVRIDEQRVRGMLSDDLEAVILWCVECRDHRFIDNISDGAAVLTRFSSWYINAGKRHKQFLGGQ
jgi:hypothetical protein